MTISIVTLFKDIYIPFLASSLIGRAQKQGLISFELSSLFDFAQSKERIDAPAYGHGAGMLLRPDVIDQAIENNEAKHGKAYKIFFSPHGQVMDQDLLQDLFKTIKDKQHCMLLPARYEGMDARVEEYYADKIVSAGNFVLMGGDIPAMMLIEGLLRLFPGIVGKQESVERESFSDAFVDYPQYTEPQTWRGKPVPEVVRSGNHKELQEWREREAAQRTIAGHFDWMRSHNLTEKQETLAQHYLPHHYVALMHSNVKLPDDKEGMTSVTSIDIHDIARSSKTFGLKGYFAVSPLKDQQKIIKTLLDFWASDVGGDYNKTRQGALESVVITSELSEVIDQITRTEGKKPLLVATSAKMEEYRNHPHPITFFDQAKVWQERRPVLFLLGTGLGLSSDLIQQCDFMLPPIKGFSSFNHLSVRSAAAVVFDRWLGNNIKNFK